ncbi:hypothetical protein COL922a_013780, partial [Colletotrichum nupharicola]
ALNEEAKHYEDRKDVFITIAQSVDNVVSCFEGPKKQIAKEAKSAHPITEHTPYPNGSAEEVPAT